MATMMLLVCGATGVCAQAPPPVQGGPAPPATVRCAPVTPPNAAGQGSGAASSQTTGESREPLSDRLARSDGVICPPGSIDPQMQKAPPDAGRTPVLPPPGSPGGDLSVRPK